MKKGFKRTRELVEELLKPGLELLSTMDDPDAKLQTLGVKDQIARMEALFAAAEDGNKKIALVEWGLTPQLFYAFDCVPLFLEMFPMMFSASKKEVLHEFIEKAESSGVPSDVCSTDRFIIGAALSGEFPENSFFVSSSAPCDGTRVAWPIIEQVVDIPTLYLETPYTYEKEAAHWYGQQIKKELIPFLEDVTGNKFDPDRFRNVIEESNKAYELLLEIGDAYTLKPAPLRAGMRSLPWGNFISAAGTPSNTEITRIFHKELYRRVKEGITDQPEEKHRVLWMHVQPTFDRTLMAWMEDTLGASVITSMLASTPSLVRPIDTTNLDTMLEGYAWQGLDMTMSMMRFDTRYFFDFMMKIYHQYNCDCIILTQHIGCKSICGASGILRRKLQEEGVPNFFIEMDYNDDRVLSIEPMKEQIEDFFTTVMA